MSNWKKIIVLFFVIAIAVGLRFYKLGQVPISPDWDEVALGYNAYSILQTGRDEFGTFLPAVFRSYDDYKPPLYVYLAVPSVAFFGLNVPAVRLPSAVFGILAVLGTYFLTREILEREGRRDGIWSFVPFISSFLLAISPWHIQFSRVAFEANIGVTLNIWAIYFFLRGLHKKVYLYVSSFLFAVSLYAYHSERIFVPLLVLVLVFTFRSRLISDLRKTTLMSFVFGLILLLPLVPVFADGNSLLRLKGTSAFREQTQILSQNIKKLTYDQEHNYILGLILDNRRIEFVKTIVSGYLIHFSPKWLFVTGDHQRHHAPDMGLMYIWELPFLLIGLYQLVVHHKKSRTLLVSWILLSPVAASVTSQLPHAIRTLVFLPSLQIVTAFGLGSVYVYLQKRPKWIAFLSLVVLGLVGVFSFVYYFHMYFAHMNVEFSKFWQYGYKEAVTYTEEHKNEYQKVVVSTDLEQPYMFFLFYSKYDPKKYLALGGTKSGQFNEQYNHFDKYEFHKIDWKKDTLNGSVLYVGTPGEIVHGTKVNISFLDGERALSITDRE